ncbi:hypothetical protein HYALB_00013230 [Hymenoscyphus albidus]|uniref:Aspartate aminotransferase family protein n=1 Tax=Hymenoscyphus albidus TaxID=595503 RepID=A0A9N9Q6K7_9HELO|nr:hypothetical protein HYALB_00013230 [Hymenoscyphus albidus]
MILVIHKPQIVALTVSKIKIIPLYPEPTAGGNYLFLEDGRVIFDASGGASVSCFGYAHPELNQALITQIITGVNYTCGDSYVNASTLALNEALVASTNGLMVKVYLSGSGTESNEIGLKLAVQYFFNIGEVKRVNIISRDTSYHGNSAGALTVSGHIARKEPFKPILGTYSHTISSCNPYRQRLDGETDAQFVARKTAELEAKFQELGPDTVIAFIMETVSGSSLGCVGPVPGYLEGMRAVCHKHGALFILDEVMCGMGRCGTYIHA